MNIKNINWGTPRVVRTAGVAALVLSGAAAVVSGSTTSAQADPPPPFTCEGDPVVCSTYGDELLNLKQDKAGHVMQFDVGVDGSLPVPGTIQNMAVVLDGLTHTRPDDIDIMLQSPDGKRLVVMSDACGAADIIDQEITIYDQAPGQFPDAAHCVTENDYDPTNHPTSTDSWTLGAPNVDQFSDFNGVSPNGHWKMEIRDDATGDPMTLGGVYLMFKAAGLQCQGKDVTVEVAKAELPTAGDDVILGTSGDDDIYGLGGNDTVCALGGNDLIRGGKGNDVIDGGAGRDITSYNESEQPVTVNLSLAGPQNTGVSTGTDTLQQVEDVYGGAGNDTITGNGGDNRLWGFEGADTVKGLGGADTVYGNLDGPDHCDGGDGVDVHGGGCEVKVNIP